MSRSCATTCSGSSKQERYSIFDWIGAAALGLLGVVAIYGFAGLSGYPPRRLIWQDLSRVPIPTDAEREVIQANVQKSFRVYLPVLVATLAVAGWLIADGNPLGMAVLVCFATPPLLALVRSIRVMRFLRQTAKT